VALIAWTLQRKLHESKDWEEAKKMQTKEKQPGVFASFGTLFTNKVNIRTMLFLAGIYISWNMVASVMGFFQQHIYETAGGLSNGEANMITAIQWIVIIAVTYFGFAMLVDKVNQRWLYVFGTSIGIVAWGILIFIGIKNHAALWTFTILWGIHAGISVQAFYALWASELFPAKYRAAAQGIMFFAVRSVAAIWGLKFVNIYGAKSEDDINKVGKSIVNSLLVKTAFYGEDANWGRIVSAIGNSEADVIPENIVIKFNDHTVVDKNYTILLDEEKAKTILSQVEFEVNIYLNVGDKQGTWWTCDLSTEYVNINANYRT